MSKKPNYPNSLSDEAKRICVQTTSQIRRFGDAIASANFSFLLNRIVFRVDFGNEAENRQTESFRSLVYEAFSNKREFVDTNSHKLVENDQEYIQSLYTQGLVFLWSRLEIVVKQLIAVLIDFDKEMLAAESLKSIFRWRNSFGLVTTKRLGI